MYWPVVVFLSHPSANIGAPPMHIGTFSKVERCNRALNTLNQNRTPYPPQPEGITITPVGFCILAQDGAA